MHTLSDSGLDLANDIAQLREKSKTLTHQIFSKLSDWQVVQLSRHPQRPYTLDYVRYMCDEFHELHGDRAFADDEAIVGGLARIDGIPVMVIGHEKGRDTNEKIRRNFGMPKPEGYRKALRLMKTAERFGLPILTYPGINAEERGQSEAIARNLMEMAELRVPIIVTVIGEGGSGGALAIGVGDVTQMMQYGVYSVISPEGCASILWKSAEKAPDAAKALGMTAPRLLELGLVDDIVNEPLGGAHRAPEVAADHLKHRILTQLKALQSMSVDDLLARRYERYMKYGEFELI